MKRVSHISWIVLFCLCACNYETELDDKLLEGLRDAFMGSSVKLSDPDSLSSSLTNDTIVNVQISGDSKAARWCLSETQSTGPDEMCAGGQGSDYGWHLSRPATISLSPGDGEKTVYVWFEKEDGEVRNEAAVASIVLDQTAPMLGVSSPAGGAYVNNNNKSAFMVAGVCTELGELVTFGGDASGQAVCSGGSFNKILDLSSLPDGLVTITVDHSDLAGNSAPQDSRSFIKDTVAPAITQNVFTNGSISNGSTVTFGGTCDNGSTITVSGADSASTSCTSSMWTYTTNPQSSDGTHLYSFTAQNPAGNTSTITASWVRDTVGPQVDSVLIADGASNLATFNTIVKVSASDSSSVTHIRLTNSNSGTDDCQSEYADDNWQSYSGGAQSYTHTVSSGDGTKKICAWAKDLAGNVSQISPSTGTEGQDMDTILYEVGTPPLVSSFEVTNNTAGPNFGTTLFSAGDSVSISWSAQDAEGLQDGPVSLYYTTNNSNWTPILQNYGPAAPSSPYTDSYIGFTAPTGGYFRLKIVVKDKANNTNVDTLSLPLNTGNWSVYAGTKSNGIGGNYNAVKLSKSTFGIATGQVAVNPVNNDIYYVSYSEAIIRSNAVTGKVENFILHGGNTLDGDTVLSGSSRVNTGQTLIRFDRYGNLYLKEGKNFYQIDVTTKAVNKLFGGGTNITEPYTAADVSVLSHSGFDLDLDRNIYFFLDCFEPAGTWSVNTQNTVKVVKAIYNSVADSYSFADYAGNCVAEYPSTGGVSALSQGVGKFRYKHLLTLAVNGDGSLLYYGEYSKYKILNGKTYASATNNRGIFFDKSNNTLYGSNGPLYSYSGAATAADNSETETVVMPITGAAGCNDDGTAINQACVNIHHGNKLGEVYVGYSSDVYFIDVGPRVRFMSNSSGKIHTALGTKPLYGEGLDKQFLRAQSLGGIYYKKASEANQSLFPEGLYFTDEYSMTLGHIDPASGIVSVIAGDQSIAYSSPAGSNFDTSISLGSQHEAHNLASLAFDSNGLPWLVVEKQLYSVDNTNTFVQRQTGSGAWSLRTQGDDPSAVNSAYNLGTGNLIVSGEGIFAIGNAPPSSTRTRGAVIQYHDYAASNVEHLIGGQVLPTEGFSADSGILGSTGTLTLDSSCNNRSTCFVQYDEANDILYFSENNLVRFLTSAKDSSNTTLGTLFDAGKTVKNFIFTENKEQVYYIASNGYLYCYDLPGGSAPAHCNNSLLGPSTGLSTIVSQGNQMTWKSSNELLINSARGEIYLYLVP